MINGWCIEVYCVQIVAGFLRVRRNKNITAAFGSVCGVIPWILDGGVPANESDEV